MFGKRGRDREVWRGRSAEIADAGVVDERTLYAALAVDPPASPPGAMADLGLRGEVVPTKGEVDAVYAGTRHGRPVRFRSGDDHGPFTEVHVAVRVDPFRAVGSGDGRFVTHGSPTAAAVLAALAPARVWRGVEAVGDAGGIVARRRGAKGWVHDLWLCEHLAAALDGATPG